MSVTSAATARSVVKEATRLPFTPLMTNTRLPFVLVQTGALTSWSSQASLLPPTITSGVLVLYPLTSATFGNDQVCPICVKPVVQLVSSVRFGQPTRHRILGAVTLVTLSP